MNIIAKNLSKIMQDKELSGYRLSKIIDCSESILSQVLNSKIYLSENVIKKLSPVIEIPEKELLSWVIADKYPKDLLESAIREKKAFPHKRKSILTTKLDAVLKEKGISRTTLAKQIVYSQSGLNRMIIGQISMSKPVMKKVAQALEIPETEILSWIVANRYKVEVLEMACECLN